jgi:glycosyltransferase involved in cell wall biosynthesis
MGKAGRRSLKVLQIHRDFKPNSGGGGVARHIDGLSKSLCALGHSVTVLSPSPEKIVDPYITMEFSFVESFKVLREHDIVHLHGSRSFLSLFFGIICFILNKPYIYTPHCYYDEDRGSIRYLSKLTWDYVAERALVNFSSATILLAESWKSYYKSRNISVDKVSIVPNCVYHADIVARASAAKFKGSTNRSDIGILTVGRIVDVKRIDDVIRVLGSIKHLEVTFHVVGKGAEMNALQALSEQLGLSENILFHGFLSDIQVVELLEICDAFVIASEMEGLPTVIIEMILLRMAVICSKIPGNMAICEKLGISTIFEVGDLDVLRGLISNSRSLKITDEQYQRCVDTFTWESRSVEIESLYFNGVSS